MQVFCHCRCGHVQSNHDHPLQAGWVWGNVWGGVQGQQHCMWWWLTITMTSTAKNTNLKNGLLNGKKGVDSTGMECLHGDLTQIVVGQLYVCGGGDTTVYIALPVWYTYTANSPTTTTPTPLHTSKDSSCSAAEALGLALCSPDAGESESKRSRLARSSSTSASTTACVYMCNRCPTQLAPVGDENPVHSQTTTQAVHASRREQGGRATHGPYNTAQCTTNTSTRVSCRQTRFARTETHSMPIRTNDACAERLRPALLLPPAAAHCTKKVRARRIGAPGASTWACSKGDACRWCLATVCDDKSAAGNIVVYDILIMMGSTTWVKQSTRLLCWRKVAAKSNGMYFGVSSCC